MTYSKSTDIGSNQQWRIERYCFDKAGLDRFKFLLNQMHYDNEYIDRMPYSRRFLLESECPICKTRYSHWDFKKLLNAPIHCHNVNCQIDTVPVPPVSGYSGYVEYLAEPLYKIVVEMWKHRQKSKSWTKTRFNLCDGDYLDALTHLALHSFQLSAPRDSEQNRLYDTDLAKRLMLSKYWTYNVITKKGGSGFYSVSQNDWEKHYSLPFVEITNKISQLIGEGVSYSLGKRHEYTRYEKPKPKRDRRDYMRKFMRERKLKNNG